MNILVEQLEGYDEPTIQKMTEAFKEFVEIQLSPELNLSRLDCIYIPNDFKEAILSFQITHNKDERGYTDNEMGTAFGKVIDFLDNGIEKDRIFLHKGIFLSLFGEDEKLKQLSVNNIHHELCHIHDHSNVEKMIDFNQQYSALPKSLNSVLYQHSMNIWEEYIVPKMSARTKSIDDAFDVEHIANLIKHTKQEMDKAVDEFIIDRDTLKIFHRVQLLGGHLLKELSTLLGNLNGIFPEKNALEDALDEVFQETYIGDTWINLKVALRGLELLYPNWDNLNVLNPLNEVVLLAWNTLRVYPEDSCDELYIRVS